jgi:hypothetical protein
MGSKQILHEWREFGQPGPCETGWQIPVMVAV